MLNLDREKTQAVADQNRQAFVALDHALVEAAQLTTAFLTASGREEGCRQLRGLHQGMV